jgi:hypothetical protein
MSKHEDHGSESNAWTDVTVLNSPLLPRGVQQGSAVGINHARILVGIAVVAVLLGAYGILSLSGALTTIADGTTLERIVVQLGSVDKLDSQIT